MVRRTALRDASREWRHRPGQAPPQHFPAPDFSLTSLWAALPSERGLGYFLQSWRDGPELFRPRLSERVFLSSPSPGLYCAGQILGLPAISLQPHRVYLTCFWRASLLLRVVNFSQHCSFEGIWLLSSGVF